MFETMKLIEFYIVYHQQLSAHNVSATRLKAKNSSQGHYYASWRIRELSSYHYAEEWHPTLLWPRSPISAILLSSRQSFAQYNEDITSTASPARGRCYDLNTARYDTSRRHFPVVHNYQCGRASSAVPQSMHACALCVPASCRPLPGGRAGVRH